MGRVSCARVVLAGVLIAAMTGCVALPPNAKPAPQDPWESWNRGVYKVNDKLDRAVAKPIARTYVRAVPAPVHCSAVTTRRRQLRRRSPARPAPTPRGRAIACAAARLRPVPVRAAAARARRAPARRGRHERSRSARRRSARRRPSGGSARASASRAWTRSTAPS